MNSHSHTLIAAEAQAVTEVSDTFARADHVHNIRLNWGSSYIYDIKRVHAADAIAIKSALMALFRIGFIDVQHLAVGSSPYSHGGIGIDDGTAQIEYAYKEKKLWL